MRPAGPARERDSVVADLVASAKTHIQHRRIGEILVEHGKVTSIQVEAALASQLERGGRLGELLMASRACDEKDVARALAEQIGLEYMDVVVADVIDPAIVAPIPITYAKQNVFLPLGREDHLLRVAVADPLNIAALDDLRTIYGCEVVTIVAPSTTIVEAINRVFDRRAGADQVMDELEGQDLDKVAHDLEAEAQDILDVDDEAPIIRLVNSILNQAVKEKASDIHIEPFEKMVSVRFRKDGVLHDIIQAPKRFQSSITSRIKIMGDLNIAEKRLPQDGRIRIKVAGRDIDIRLSTVPTSHGERLVMRLLDKTNTVLDLQKLGFSRANLDKMEQLLKRPHGIILVTGPTGSGKTTTLYAALTSINSPDKNILTVEDPVEYQIHGIGQMQVNPKINFTFASGLRAILRQDPDVVLVGEIRDIETAEIAVQASLTGHLVFSTVHTNDSASTFTRLIDMGVEPFLIASSVATCLAQRLVRRVCMHCREPYEPADAELDQLNLFGPQARFASVLQERFGGGRPTFYRAVGCKECASTGYSGRAAIYEMLVVSDEIRNLVMQNVAANEIKRAAVKGGMLTLLDDGALKVIGGATTSEEVFRVASVREEVL